MSFCALKVGSAQSIAAPQRARGFTLIEVLIAMAITALVAAIAYSSLARVMAGVEGLRENADRSYEVNRAMMILSRDIRHFAPRAIRDEFGDVEPALTGGELAEFELSFTRTGWHNPQEHPRSSLQRVNYRIEDNALWRDSYVVLDRAGDTEPRSTLLLDDVELMELAFLGKAEGARLEFENGVIDTSQWAENWVETNTGTPADPKLPPEALEITLTLQDWGELRRFYVLPPL
ncbi:MAG: type II secretion system minor pseudopilin GspJ [Halioglobus sp.]